MKSILKEEKEEKWRLIIADLDFDFEDERSLKIAYYGKGHVDNGSLRLFVEGEEYLFNPDQVESLREFLRECRG